MKEPNRLISEKDLPLSAPPVEHAWEEMRKLLEKDSPEAVPVLPLHKRGLPGLAKYFSVAALLLIAIAFFMYRTSEENMATAVPSESSGLTSNQSITHEADTLITSSELSPANNDQANSEQDLDESSHYNSTPIGSTSGAAAIKHNALPGGFSKTSHANHKKPDGRDNPNNLSAGGLHRKPDALLSKESVEIANKTDSVTADIFNAPAVDYGLDRDSLNTKSVTRMNDSSANASAAEPPHIILPEEKWTYSAGLHWTVPVPSFNAANYFIGPNGQSQPYRLLLPGAWIQAEKEKQLITLDINPFAVSLPPSKVFRTVTTLENSQDTLVQTTDQRTLIKTFGLSAGVGYQYKIGSNWWVGVGVQLLFWKRAVAGSDAAINKIPTGGTAGVITNQQYVYKLTDEWSYFSKMQASVNPEILYKTPKWQAGFRLSVFVTPLAQQDGPKYFLRAELVYRLKLLDIHLKE